MGDIPEGAVRAGVEPRPVIPDLDAVLALCRPLPAPLPPSERVIALGQWIAERGLEAVPVGKLVDGLMPQLLDAGLRVSRVQISGSTLHPQFVAYMQTWWRDRPTTEFERLPLNSESTGVLNDSPMSVLLGCDLAALRFDPQDAKVKERFALLADYGASGMTDYLSEKMAFGLGGPVHPDHMMGTTMSWMTDVPGGFSDQEIADLRAIGAWLAMAVRICNETDTIDTLLSVYLGEDAGRRVARGQIRRGDVVRMRAAILYADLRGFTAASTQLETKALVELVNEYFGHIVGAISDQGGQVLKFIGDGLLAIFPLDEADPAATTGRALAAARTAIAAVDHVNGERGDGPKCPALDVALHVGELLYGNVGAPDRLDFTVIGSSVNAISRMEGLCQSLSAPLIMSDAFVEHGGEGLSVRSLGSHDLRGLTTPMEVFAPA